MGKKSIFKHRPIKSWRISSIWIIPIITLFIGAWLIFSRLQSQGVEITLITNNANGITAGKTIIKNKSIDIGLVKTVTLSPDFKQVIITAVFDKKMDPLVKNDSVFWLVQPKIGIDGVSGLGTLLSGVYIEMSPGADESKLKSKTFNLLADNPYVSIMMDGGIELTLDSDEVGTISAGSPVLFREIKVGVVTKSELNIQTRKMQYSIHINAPYTQLVTENIRFWKEGGINLSFSPSGSIINVPPLETLLLNGISFDLPTGSEKGKVLTQPKTFILYPNKQAIQDSQYTEEHEFLLLFSESIAGLEKGSQVEFRGIQLGVVEEVPFYTDAMTKELNILRYDIPVLITIQPQRLKTGIDIVKLIKESQKSGLRASLKTANFITGSMIVNLDFYSDQKNNAISSEMYGYDTIKTVSNGLSQMQNKVMHILNNISDLPLNKTVTNLNESLRNSKELLASLNAMANSPEMKKFPKDMQALMKSLDETLNGLKPGSKLYKDITTNSQHFDQVMIDLNKLIQTLNSKNNALIFPTKTQPDVQPKAKGTK